MLRIVNGLLLPQASAGALSVAKRSSRSRLLMSQMHRRVFTQLMSLLSHMPVGP